MLTIWEITGTRQRLRYGIFQGVGEPNPLLDDFEMLNESFGELWLMVNTGKPVRKLRTLPADADVATRWNTLAQLEAQVDGYPDFTYEEQLERLRLLDEEEDE